MRSAYLGPTHSYSHLAAIKYFGDATTLTPVASIPAVFDAVANGDALTGIVPIENSTDGRVVDTLGMFVRREMEICGEVLLPIHHNLLSKTPRAEIVEVHSKPQALSQCRGWLSSQLPAARLVEISSTAAAAKLASEKHGVAAVASIEAGRQYDLDVINANIEDNPNNITRFAVLGKERPPRTGDDKTAILFQVNHQPGALADAMTIFKAHNLNLTWIESFPAPETQNEYLFFVELAGHRDDDAVAQAIAALGKQTQRLTILGSYPRALAE
jgi:chorismate mutase/prephenate dehydratase